MHYHNGLIVDKHCATIGQACWDTAFSMIVAPTSSRRQTMELLSAAHGAWYWWNRWGNEDAMVLADWAVAHAYIRAGDTKMALTYSRRAVEKAELLYGAKSTIELALAYEVGARVSALAGKEEHADVFLRTACDVAGNLKDRAALDKFLEVVMGTSKLLKRDVDSVRRLTSA